VLPNSYGAQSGAGRSAVEVHQISHGTAHVIPRPKFPKRVSWDGFPVAFSGDCGKPTCGLVSVSCEKETLAKFSLAG